MRVSSRAFASISFGIPGRVMQNGVPLMIVARNLGHVDTKMVERTYGHLEQNYVVQAIRERAPRFGQA